MDFDAVSIEYAFAKLVGDPIGARGTAHDADVFRVGNPKSLAKALDQAANAIEKRTKSITFSSSEVEAGGARARLNVAIGQLRAVAEGMAKAKHAQLNYYDWEVIGSLISITTALIEHLESAP